MPGPLTRVTRATRNLIGDRILVALVLATLAGVAMVVAGGLVHDRAYLPEVLLQFGSSFVLVVPLVLLGRMIEVRLRQAERQTNSMVSDLAEVREAVARLDQVGAATRARIEESHHAWDQNLATVTERPTQRNVAGLVDRATEAGLVAPGGCRVRVPGTDLRLRFTLTAPATGRSGPAATRPAPTDSGPGPADPGLRLTLERADGTPLRRLDWLPGVPAETVAQEVADAVIDRNEYPGHDGFDASALLADLVGAVRYGVELRFGPEPRKLGALVEVIGPQWAVAEDGLYCLDRDYRIPLTRLGGTGEDWRSHMLAKSWVNRDEFLTAYRTAVTLLSH